MVRIQTILSICYHVEAIKAVVDTLLRQPQLTQDIVVIENPSEYTESDIKPFIMDLMDKGHVTQYFLTDRNITHNATKRIILDGKININKTKKILITNGNLSCKYDSWFPKQLHVLNTYSNVMVCGVPISMENCPKGNERAILPMHSTKPKDYDIGFGGKHMLLMRSSEFNDFTKTTLPSKPYIDATLHHYTRKKGKLWTIIKDPKFYRHTWDLMTAVPRDPYIDRKGKHLLKGFWRHEQYCSYTMYLPDGSSEKTEIKDNMKKVFE